MKYIKLFEEFKEATADETQLTAGERRALAKGQELTEKDQAAACYCIAQKWFTEIGLNNVPEEVWHLKIGLNPVTYKHTRDQFKNMIAGRTNDPQNQENPKFRRFYENKFKNNKEEAIALAIECLEKDHEKAPSKAKPKSITVAVVKDMDEWTRNYKTAKTADGKLAYPMTKQVREKALKKVAELNKITITQVENILFKADNK